MQDLHLFSMDDLLKVKKGQLCAVAKALLQSSVAHIDFCEVCKQSFEYPQFLFIQCFRAFNSHRFC